MLVFFLAFSFSFDTKSIQKKLIGNWTAEIQRPGDSPENSKFYYFRLSKSENESILAKAYEGVNDTESVFSLRFLFNENTTTVHYNENEVFEAQIQSSPNKFLTLVGTFNDIQYQLILVDNDKIHIDIFENGKMTIVNIVQDYVKPSIFAKYGQLMAIPVMIVIQFVSAYYQRKSMTAAMNNELNQKQQQQKKKEEETTKKDGNENEEEKEKKDDDNNEKKEEIKEDGEKEEDKDDDKPNKVKTD